MYASCHSLTADELQLIPITWIDCHVKEDLDIDDRKKPVWHWLVATSITLRNLDVIPVSDPALILLILEQFTCFEEYSSFAKDFSPQL
jgi:hypothetical protein